MTILIATVCGCLGGICFGLLLQEAYDVLGHVDRWLSRFNDWRKG